MPETEMLDGLKLKILVQGLTLFLLGPACSASSLGLVVHVEPLDRDGGETVRAHFTMIAPSPCPQFSGLCSTGEDCLFHTTYLPFTGAKPSGWCVRQWQKTVPSNYNATVTLGSTVEVYVSMKAGPKIRPNNGKLNRPPYVALPPPLRARVNCRHHFHLSVLDLDKDTVRCRFARADQGECLNCTQHSFIELDEESCELAFTGAASAGRYSLVLMVEDLLPVPSYVTYNKPLSSIPVHLSLTVEEPSSSCSAEPVPTGQTPKQGHSQDVLPYEQVDLTVSFISELESVLELAVVGPPALFRSDLQSAGSVTTMTMAWVRSHNKLPPLLPICFVANTNSLQSDPTCVWLYQGEMKAARAGIDLQCGQSEMRVVVPVVSLTNVNLTELQLNSPNCPVSYNTTHLTASIPLTGCGTKRVHSGTDLIYTNTLKTVRPYQMISRLPSFILPLACVLAAVQVQGPQYQITVPSERQTFGTVTFWLEIHLPGEGPFANVTRHPRFLRSRSGRVQRAAEALPSESNDNSPKSIGSTIKHLDLHVMSNCSMPRAELMVGKCMESETEEFAGSHTIMDQGCMASNSTLEIITSVDNSKVYRIDMSTMTGQGSTMYMECTVHLCIPTMPSQKCPNYCTRSSRNTPLISNMFTRSYTVRSGAISRVVTTAAPATTAVTTTPATTTTTTAAATGAGTTTTATAAGQDKTTSHAPDKTSAVAQGLIFTFIFVFLQNIVLY